MEIHDLDDIKNDLMERRMNLELEKLIRDANTKSIGKVTGGVTRQNFVKVAITVSALRAQYFRSILKLQDIDQDPEVIQAMTEDLRRKREAYEEALKGFGALRHALGRGYFDLKD